MQNALGNNQPLGSAKIIHVFHPLYGKSYKILKIRKMNGIRYYSLFTDPGTICVPESWTDRDEKQKISTDKLYFDAFTLIELAELIQSFDNFKNKNS